MTICQNTCYAVKSNRFSYESQSAPRPGLAQLPPVVHLLLKLAARKPALVLQPLAPGRRELPLAKEKQLNRSAKAPTQERKRLVRALPEALQAARIATRSAAGGFREGGGLHPGRVAGAG
jgi:hypothetical protein